MLSNKNKIKVLIVEDEKNLRLVLQKELTRLNHKVSVATEGSIALEILQKEDFDIVLLDLKLPYMSGIDILKQVRKEGFPVEVIILTGYATVETAIEAMKLGAYDYLTKPYKIDELNILIKNAYEKKKLAKENIFLTSRLQRKEKFPDIITDSPKMKEILNLIAKVAKSDSTVLITGESGTGKELVARAIHNNSLRQSASFIDINCGAIQETLLESELFGYEKGAFTGADSSKPGLFEMADHGTIFLDEIGELNSLLQVKVLRVLETKSFYRVGGVKKIKVDVRIIAATNKDLGAEVESGKFRNDLYYRINAISIPLPPLRERVEDIPLLAQHFLEEFGFGGRKKLSEEALEIFKNYSWPGNIRELKNAIERMVLLSPHEIITAEDLPLEIYKAVTSKEPDDESVISLKDVEREQILSVLESVEWHRGKAAGILGISPKTLYRKIKMYDLDQVSKTA